MVMLLGGWPTAPLSWHSIVFGISQASRSRTFSHQCLSRFASVLCPPPASTLCPCFSSACCRCVDRFCGGLRPGVGIFRGFNPLAGRLCCAQTSWAPRSAGYAAMMPPLLAGVRPAFAVFWRPCSSHSQPTLAHQTAPPTPPGPHRANARFFGQVAPKMHFATHKP